MKKLFILLFLFFISFVFATENKNSKPYSFSVFDGSLDSFTMRQMDINYLTTSRLVNRSVEEIFEDKTFLKIKLSDWINYTWPMFTYAVTHEEGHRSILTAQKIGSISQSFFNIHGAAYVKGVADDTLINLRNTDKVNFIRMYTAGIESDYMMSKRGEMAAAFETDSFSILYPDFMFRRMMILGYLCSGIVYDGAEQFGGVYKWITEPMNLKEEENELERDICGFDIFGAAKALFENDYSFHRYVQWSDLTSQEKEFLIKRVGYRSYLNLLSLFLFIEENCYFKFRNTVFGDLDFSFYAKQYQNYKNWYSSFGLGIVDFSPIDWFSISSEAHIWWQPEKLDFYAGKSFFGGAFELTLKAYLINSGWQSMLHKIGFKTSFLVKSKGFMPEIEHHAEHIRFSMGIEIMF